MNQKTKENIQKIAEITHFMEESVWENDTQVQQNHKENVLKSIINEKDFSYENVEHKIRAVNMLYCIDRDNKVNNDKCYDTIKRLVGNEKAIKFYEENKAKITKDIKQEAKDYGYSEEKLINMICEGQKAKNDNGYFQKIALARYSIYQTAQNFQESIAYGLSENDYRFATNEVKEYESKLTQKMFEIFNKYNKKIEDENQIINLIDKGADVNAHEKDNGATPLMLACGSYDYDKLGNGNLRIAKFLIENGADINCRNEFGDTPLMVACQYKNLEAVKFLIENDADIHAKDNFDNTALNKAYSTINSFKQDNKESYEIIDFLKSKGATMLSCNDYLKGLTQKDKDLIYKRAEDRINNILLPKYKKLQKEYMGDTKASKRVEYEIENLEALQNGIKNKKDLDLYYPKKFIDFAQKLLKNKLPTNEKDKSKSNDFGMGM